MRHEVREKLNREDKVVACSSGRKPVRRRLFLPFLRWWNDSDARQHAKHYLATAISNGPQKFLFGTSYSWWFTVSATSDQWESLSESSQMNHLEVKMLTNWDLQSELFNEQCSHRMNFIIATVLVAHHTPSSLVRSWSIDLRPRRLSKFWSLMIHNLIIQLDL